MKILIFSDSHRYIDGMTEAIEREKPDHIIHLGDLEGDAEELRRIYPMMPICSVPGNCDFASAGPKYLLFELGGKKFFITHGHNYGVKYQYDGLINTALTAGADVALFGHTHTPYESNIAGMLVVNPGSIESIYGTYGVLTLKDGNMNYELKDCR